jgi:hypothetical protein
MTTKKKTDSGRTVLRGSIPTELYQQFKIDCIKRGINNSQALELILTKHLELNDLETEDAARELEPSHN